MANVDINLSPYTAESEAIARRMKMAELLQQQAMQPLETPGIAGGYQLAVSPYAGLAKILQGYTSMQAGRGAEAERKALGERYRSDQSADFSNLAKILSAPAVAGQAEIPARAAEIEIEEMEQSADYGTPLPGAAIPAVPARRAGQIDPEMMGQFKTPEAQQMAMAQLLSQIGPKAPIKASPGDVFFTPEGKELFRAPDKQEFGTTPTYETENGKTYAVYSDKQGNRKKYEATPQNQYTTGTVDAGAKLKQDRELSDRAFYNLSVKERANLENEAARLGISGAQLYYDTGLRAGGGAVLPPKISPQQVSQVVPQGAASTPVVPTAVPRPMVPAAAPPPVVPAAVPRPVVPTAVPQPNAVVPQAQPEARPPGITPKKWDEITAKRLEKRLEEIKDAKDVKGLLTGVEDLIDTGSGGFFQNLYGGTQAAFKIKSAANDADATLKVIAGALTSKMPKMSGPQSDADVLLYKQMAGDIGNANLSQDSRKAAVQVVRAIQDAYINGFSETGYLPNARRSSGTIGPSEAPKGAVRRIL